MQLIIHSDIIKSWLGQSDAFSRIGDIKGKVVRSREGRTTQRFEIDEQGFYVKFHRGVGWKEIIKNLLQMRLPIIGASNEWLAINRLHQLGLDTMKAVAFGKKGINPASRHSFIITEELNNVIELSDVTESWAENPPSFKTRAELIKRVAQIARDLHQGGINHRDFYLCHFLLHVSDNIDLAINSKATIYLIDLHRAQIRAQVPSRWLVKDLGSLYFSSLDIGLRRNDIYRFFKEYFQQPLREILAENRQLFVKVESRALKLYKRDFACLPQKLPVKAL